MTKKKIPIPPKVPTTEVRFLFGGGYRVEVCEQFDTQKEADAFAKKLGLPIKQTADVWD
jgi:hypothetical protein